MKDKRAWWGFGPTYFRLTVNRAALFLNAAGKAIEGLTGFNPHFEVDERQDYASGFTTSRARTEIELFATPPWGQHPDGEYFTEVADPQVRQSTSRTLIAKTWDSKDFHNFALGIVFACDCLLASRRKAQVTPGVRIVLDERDVTPPQEDADPRGRAIQFLKDLLRVVEEGE